MSDTTQQGSKKNLYSFLISLLVGLLAVVIGAYRLNDWRYFLVGDEYGFYTAAQQITQRRFNADPFSSGVHVMNYMAVSFYQALFLVFKQSFWMWRFSNIILFIPICACIYVWGKTWFSPRVGMLAALFVSTSFFLHNYFLIGYPNPLAVLFLCTLHAAWSVWSTRDSSTLAAAVALGCLTGICYYVYLGPLIIISVTPYVGYKLLRLKSRLPLLASLLVAALCATALIVPGLLRSDALEAMLRVTSRAPEFSDRAQILVNIKNCFRMFWWNPRVSHFISGPYLDQITLYCFMLGLISMCLSRRPGSILLITTFSLIAILVGATSPYAYPATTRGVIFLPFGCLAAAVGFDWITRRLPRAVQTVGVGALCLGLVATNMQRAEAFHRTTAIPVDLVFMRDLRAALANCPSADTVRAHYQEGLPLMNALPNLSFFMSVQTGRPITIVRAEQASGAEATADPLVCEFHFSQPESEAKQAR